MVREMDKNRGVGIPRVYLNATPKCATITEYAHNSLVAVPSGHFGSA
jgi:hypothetical protein